MFLRKFTLRWWATLIFPLLFITTGWCLLPYPGLHNDEVLFANAQFHLPAAVLFGATVFEHTVPLMFLTYLGALKAWLYAPVLALFEPSYGAVRLPVLFLGGFPWCLLLRSLAPLPGRRPPC